MNGSPVINVLSFLLCYLPFALPLYWVTHYTQPLPAEASLEPTEINPSTQAEQHSALLLVQSAHPWESASVIIDGGTSIEFQGPSSQDELMIDMNDICHITFEIKWPEQTPETAVRVEIQPDLLETQHHTAWGYQTLREEITFEWTHE